MSQDNVERVLGRLVTDEAFRHSFSADPAATLQALIDAGLALNPCEIRALTSLDPELVDGFADALDPRIQKTDLRGGGA